MSRIVLLAAVLLTSSSALACEMETEAEGMTLADLFDEVDAVETQAEERVQREVAAAEAEIDAAITDAVIELSAIGASIRQLALGAPAAPMFEDTRVVAMEGSFEEVQSVGR